MLKSRICGLGLALGVSTVVGQGHAQTAVEIPVCQETQFSAANAELYLAAETELIANKNAAGALVGLDRLLSQPLNCYEEGAALRLGAAVKLELQNYASAARDLETALSKGYIAEAAAVQTYYSLSQLYLRLENTPRSLEYYDKWLAAGGSPTPDQKWTLAVLKAQMGRYDEAMTLAETVLASQGASPRVEVQDFLVTVYGQTGKYQKQAALLQQMLSALRAEQAAPATPAAPAEPPKEIKLMAPPGSTKTPPASADSVGSVEPISDSDARPIRPPVPNYPIAAAERGLEGECEVQFDIDSVGVPYNIYASCSDVIFKRSAELAVSKAMFAPKIVAGQAVERFNVVYPLGYSLSD